MLDTNFRLCWETFRSNLSDGFSKLQQMQEFVDVTLAAGGCFVKAHQNVIAVASPYLKEMLKSTPSQHPVIFLGPISHTVLCFILEYIYTGEVNVPSHVLPAFVDAAKLLHIAGIKDIQLPQDKPEVKKPSEVVNIISEDLSTNNIINTTDDRPHSELEVNPSTNSGENIPSDNYESNVNPDESLTGQTLDNNENCDMDLDFENLIKIKSIPKYPDVDPRTSQYEQPTNSIEENPSENVKFNAIVSETDDQMEIPSASSNNDCNDVFRISKESNGKQGISALATPLYTRSNRGSLQMVMNRFIYYLHHTSYANKKRRWRCINYRKKHCTAFIDTNGEIIITRKNVHNHPFLDNEILKIGRRKQFFTSIAEANEHNSQHLADNCNAGEITDKNTGEQGNYEIKIEFGQISIT